MFSTKCTVFLLPKAVCHRQSWTAAWRRANNFGRGRRYAGCRSSVPSWARFPPFCPQVSIGLVSVIIKCTSTDTCLHGQCVFAADFAVESNGRIPRHPFSPATPVPTQSLKGNQNRVPGSMSRSSWWVRPFTARVPVMFVSEKSSVPSICKSICPKSDTPTAPARHQLRRTRWYKYECPEAASHASKSTRSTSYPSVACSQAPMLHGTGRQRHLAHTASALPQSASRNPVP